MTGASLGATIKNVVAAGKGTVPSAARRLSVLEAHELGETAMALPDGWVVTVEAPYGQLALVPAANVRWHTGCFVADRRSRRVTRLPWRPAL